MTQLHVMCTLFYTGYLKISGTGTDVADKMVSDLAASDDADDPNYTPPLDLDFSSENGDFSNLKQQSRKGFAQSELPSETHHMGPFWGNWYGIPAGYDRGIPLVSRRGIWAPAGSQVG